MIKTVVPIGADHRGYALKAHLIGWLEQNGYAPEDLGAHGPERCDALDYAKALAADFKSNPVQFGILVCGSGQAMAMTANRHQHLRAALCGSGAMAKTAREHNDANVLVLGADFTSPDEALKILQAFLDTKFLDGKYAERRDALTALGGL
jgi:ribose 5-phosphate isomerase B